jgi:hypothetical protein
MAAERVTGTVDHHRTTADKAHLPGRQPLSVINSPDDPATHRATSTAVPVALLSLGEPVLRMVTFRRCRPGGSV